MTMKRFFTNILLFVIILAILDVVAICVLGGNASFDITYYRKVTWGHMFSRTKDIPNHKNPDILFLGSSHAYRSFDGRIFERSGITTFNLGSSNQTPIQTEVLLKKYIDEIKPKHIVFEVYPTLFEIDGVESTSDLISNDHIDFETCKLAVKSGNIKLINTLIYGLYMEYCRDEREKFVEETVNCGDKYVSGGYVERIEYTPFVSDGSIEHTKIQILPKQLRAFGNCVRIVKERQIPYILVIAPLPKTIYKGFDNIDEFNQTMSSYGKLIDFNKILHFDDSCFYDADHLTQKGVETFDSCFIECLDSLKTQGDF